MARNAKPDEVPKNVTLERVISGFRAQKIKLTSNDLIESMWLVSQGLLTVVPRLEQAGKIEDQPKIDGGTTEENQKKDLETIPPELPVHPVVPPVQPTPKRNDDPTGTIRPQPESSSGTGATRGMPLAIPGGRALPKALAIARALRPLKRRVPSRLATVFDEESTVQRIAEQEVWLPVTRPSQTRWLEAALVVDTGSSMLVWERTPA